MANKKGVKVSKPTLAEIKGLPGKYIFVTYEGVDCGGWCLPTPRPRFAGDIVEPLVIIPFEPTRISDEWLEDPKFELLYNKVPGIKIVRSDGIVEKPNLDLPEDLANRLTDVQKAMALIVASSPFDEKMKDIIETQDREASEEQVLRTNNRIVLPFLKTVEFYESRLMKRPEVLTAIRNRVKRILDEKSKIETLESF